MKKSDLFRQHHFFNLLERFDLSRGPLDLFVHLYFRHNRQLGSKDRAWISEKMYTYFRWQNLIDYELAKLKVADEARRQALLQMLDERPTVLDGEAWVRVGFPKELYEAFVRSYGESTDALCLACNEQAPCSLRANTLKISREDLIQRLIQEGVEAAVDPSAPCAIRLGKRCNIFSLPSFGEGLFEVQDAGSQQVADFVPVGRGQSFLDYCAGSGGKALAIAPKLEGTGQIFLHDIRGEALLEARRRLCRAGIQNAQIVMSDDSSRLSMLKRRMDCVLVDAPCTGTGTLRRNPDMKWKFSEEMLHGICVEQRQIFDKALRYVKNGGIIVYATCSLLREENEEQAQYFENAYPGLKRVGVFSSSPATSSMDGFYAVAFKL